MGNQAASLEGAEELLTDSTHQRGRDKHSQRIKHRAAFAAAIEEFELTESSRALGIAAQGRIQVAGPEAENSGLTGRWENSGGS